jgi:hypothetical protein
MRRNIQRLLGALSLLAFVFGLSQAATCQVPSKFAASYQLANIVENGDTVELTINLTLLNPNSSDVKGGIVALYDTEPNRNFLGSFQAVKSLPHQGQAVVSGAFTISAYEYTRWQRGHAPVLEFLVPSGAGTSIVSIQTRRSVNPGESIN